MNSLSFLALIVVVIAQLVNFAAANDPLLADAHGLGLDLKEHIASLAKEERLLETINLVEVTASPSLAPTDAPDPDDTLAPTLAPTVEPTASVTTAPTAAPTTLAPTAAPTTLAPTAAPTTLAPAALPTATPNTMAPTAAPTTLAPTNTAAPTSSAAPTNTAAPTSSAAPTISAAPTRVPTRAPTNAPTAAPTVGSTPVISFSSAIGLNGLTTSTLDTNTRNSITQATCTTMGLTDTSACSFWGSVVTSSARRMLRDTSAADMQLATTYNVQAYVNTTVSVPAGESATTYYNSLATAVANTTAFGISLQSAAADNGATATLSSVTVSGVTSSAPVVSTPTTASDDDNNDLSKGAIAGIVIGVVVGFALICLAVYFVFFRESSGYSSTGDSNFNARHHRKSNELPITL